MSYQERNRPDRMAELATHTGIPWNPNLPLPNLNPLRGVRQRFSDKESGGDSLPIGRLLKENLGFLIASDPDFVLDSQNLAAAIKQAYLTAFSANGSEPKLLVALERKEWVANDPGEETERLSLLDILTRFVEEKLKAKNSLDRKVRGATSRALNERLAFATQVLAGELAGERVTPRDSPYRRVRNAPWVQKTITVAALLASLGLPVVAGGCGPAPSLPLYPAEPTTPPSGETAEEGPEEPPAEASTEAPPEEESVIEQKLAQLEERLRDHCLRTFCVSMVTDPSWQALSQEVCKICLGDQPPNLDETLPELPSWGEVVERMYESQLLLMDRGENYYFSPRVIEMMGQIILAYQRFLPDARGTAWAGRTEAEAPEMKVRSATDLSEPPQTQRAVISATTSPDTGEISIEFYLPAVDETGNFLRMGNRCVTTIYEEGGNKFVDIYVPDTVKMTDDEVKAIFTLSTVTAQQMSGSPSDKITVRTRPFLRTDTVFTIEGTGEQARFVSFTPLVPTDPEALKARLLEIYSGSAEGMFPGQKVRTAVEVYFAHGEFTDENLGAFDVAAEMEQLGIEVRETREFVPADRNPYELRSDRAPTPGTHFEVSP